MKSIIAVVLCLGCSISGCGGYGNSNNSQTTVNVTGNWQFTFTSTKNGGSQNIAGALTQNGGNFSGNLSISGSGSCVSSGTISGTTLSYSLNGTITASNQSSSETISFTGTAASSGNTASGTYQVTSTSGTSCASASGDSGTWTGSGSVTVTVSSSSYAVVVQSADRIPVQFVLNLKSNGGQVSGTANFANSACLHSMNVAGTLSGTNLELQGGGGTDGSIVMSGTTDSQGNILTLNSTVSGACQAESGTGTVVKVQ